MHIIQLVVQINSIHFRFLQFVWITVFSDLVADVPLSCDGNCTNKNFNIKKLITWNILRNIFSLSCIMLKNGQHYFKTLPL